MIQNLQASVKLALLLLWIGLWCGPVWTARKLGKLRSRDRMVQWCYRGLLCIVGIRLATTSHPVVMRPLLLVTNHVSYLDIMLLGASAPVRFTPKSEVAAWPVIGGICRMCDAIFIDRRPEKIGEMKQALQAALARGEIVCLFPEATTGDGLHLQPFRSGFFSLAEEAIQGRELIVQPAAIRYRRIRRLPIDTAQWPQIAWYGDMELAPHLWNLLKLGPIDAELNFLPPVAIGQFSGRKPLATHCRDVIAKAMER